MTKSSEVLVRPLFYDALSGEFNPPSDPLSRPHTLGRLAYGSMEKGDEVFDIPDGLLNAGFRAYRYVPSWAKTVESTAILDASGRYPILSALHLLHDANTLHAKDDTSGSDTPRIRLEKNGHVSLEMPLELGVGITNAQTRVVIAAQEFFDQVES